MDQKNCKSCKHFEPRTGFCRRFPPAPITIVIEDKTDGNKKKTIVVSKYAVPAYPESDWCGEHAEKVF